jgi:serine/threonine-protein kinase
VPIGQVIAERYRALAALGEGTFGAVYEVERLADGQRFAMKILKDEVSTAESRSRLRREATALATLAHPSVVAVVELGEHEGRLFLVTELLVGTALDAVLSDGMLAPQLALKIMDRVLGGLAFAHAMGVTHRDLKPGNVFLVGGLGTPEALQVKLLDFGLAKFHEPAAFGHHTALTGTGAIMGTPDYMAPEQVFGRHVDARADVYAAGVLLFELLTGRVPFVCDELTELFRAHAVQTPPSLAEARPDRSFVPELEALVQKALSKQQGDRFSDARAMRTALDRLPKDRPAVRHGQAT